MPIIRFGNLPGQTFDFDRGDLLLHEYEDNFSDFVPRTLRLPGMDGGFDEFGRDRAPQEIGKITQRLWLIARTRADMSDLRDELRAMNVWGVQRLYLQLSDRLTERMTWARINSIQLPQKPHEHTDLQQPITVIWQAADPRWFSLNPESTIWGGGDNWGGGAKWGGSVAPSAISGTTTNLTFDNNGNAPVYPRIFVTAGAGQTIQNIVITRLVGGIARDRIGFSGTITAGGSILIDPMRAKVQVNGVAAYNSFTFLRPQWLELPPGSNSIRVTMQSGGNAGSLKLYYTDGWY